MSIKWSDLIYYLLDDLLYKIKTFESVDLWPWNRVYDDSKLKWKVQVAIVVD